MRYRRYVNGIVFLAAFCTAATSASAADVRGRILLGAYKPEPLKGPRPGFHWELDNGFKETLKDRIDASREIAVVLTGSAPADQTGLNVVLYGGSLLPSTIVVRVGATVSIENQDEIAHELYAVGLKAFGAEAISPRGRRAINFKEAGSWVLRDQLVPHARGYLHVLPDLVSVASVEKDGSFKFGDVAPGDYTLRVFDGAKEIASKPVSVTDKSTTLDPFTPSGPDNGAN